MFERPTIYVLLYAVSILGLQGQSIDSVVQDAVTSAFNKGRGTTRQPTRERSLIPTSIAGRTADPPSGSSRGSSAVNSLNRFSQNNEPEMNQLLDDRARFAAEATKTIAASPALAAQFSGSNANERAQLVTSDAGLTASFRRAVSPFCYEIPFCNSRDPYRTADGSCNNLYNPLLGKSFTPQSRILQNAYNDYIELPRTLTSDRQGSLPSARVVSNTVLSGSTPTSATHSTFLTHFGQFIDHDVISTPSMREGSPPGSINDCCSGVRNKFSCFTIPVPSNDPYYQGRTCMNMVRHAAALPLDCTNGVREQQNQRSSFIDGTAIYGFHRTRELALREQRGGRLRESDLNPGLLPRSRCPLGISTQYHCFMAGDHRQSETPTLTIMHTTWLRRHNLIADALRTATGITDDETLFQEAKRIVVAELQHITYNEFLPAVLNNRHLNFFNLLSRRSGHDNIYNPSVDPRTFNSFGAAVLRMGHSLVRNVVGHDNGRGQVQTFPLKDHFENPDLIFSPSYGYEYMARWMSKSPKSRSDRTLVDGIRNRLFEGPPGPYPSETLSFDLGALNIQRGREHGLPPYNAFRRFCGRYPAYHFSTTSRGGLVDHSPQNAARLARVYRSPHDIDLYAGGISETPVRGGILGPTFSCLLAYQFSLYKHGDRFWYENNDHENPRTAFTQEQLAEIKQMTHSKVLCSVVKNDLGEIRYQPRLFQRPEVFGNNQRPCTQILNGNYLGFDITPFTNELIRLRGSRRSTANPINGLTGAFARRLGSSSNSLGATNETRTAPTNVGFRVPNPSDVLDATSGDLGGNQDGAGSNNNPNAPNSRGQTGGQATRERRKFGGRFT